MKKTRIIKGNKNDAVVRKCFNQYLEFSPLPDKERLNNLGLFIRRQSMSRIIFMYELYKKIVPIHGNVFEFGVLWGQDLAMFESFRGMLEPFNFTRKIVGFDTFAGFPSVSNKDNLAAASKGDYGVTEGYEKFLNRLLRLHEKESPLSHIKKFEIIRGDATSTCKKYLQKHPETIIAFAYFDFDLYEPTKICLEVCRDYFTKGSIIAFDELNHPDWPGESIALRETLGLSSYKICRLPFVPGVSYLVIE